MAPLVLLLLRAALFFGISHCFVAIPDWPALNASVDGRLFSLLPLAFPCYTKYNNTVKTPDSAACTAINAKKKNTEYIAGQAGGLIVVCSRIADPCAHGQVCVEMLWLM
jgi:hypothetical protein